MAPIINWRQRNKEKTVQLSENSVEFRGLKGLKQYLINEYSFNLSIPIICTFTEIMEIIVDLN